MKHHAYCIVESYNAGFGIALEKLKYTTMHAEKGGRGENKLEAPFNGGPEKRNGKKSKIEK